jgi:hypothetical protein
MLSENRYNVHSVRIPASWSLPKFVLNQRVSTPDGLTHKIGWIIGIEWFAPDDPRVTDYQESTGWHYSIKIDPNTHPDYWLIPVLCAAESDLSPQPSPELAPIH